MARPRRHVRPGGLYHANSRGNRACSVYEEDTDRRRFLDLLATVTRRDGWSCLAYCLMTTHYHLVLAPSERLSEGMHSLNGRYATWFNRRHDYKGHLFESRFHAVEIVTDWHLLEAVRYVVLNPVRAGLCERPEEWVWSSYRASIGSVAPPAFLDVERLLGVFGPDKGRARPALRQFVENALPRSLAA